MGGVELALDPDGQGFAGELVDDAQHPELSSFMGPPFDEVIGPDVVGPGGAQPRARAVVEPEAAALRLLLWALQPLPPPDALHPLGIHRPARVTQQGGDPPVAVADIGLGQLDDVGGQRRLVVTGAGRLALRGAVLAKGSTDEDLVRVVLEKVSTY